MLQQPLLGQGILLIEALRLHAETPHLVGLLWTSDQPFQRPPPDNTQHSRHPCSRRDSNLQSQQASGGRTTS